MASWRRLLVCPAGGLLCFADFALAQAPATQPATATQPLAANVAGAEPAIELLERLRSAPLRSLEKQQIALRAALEFCVALGAADAPRIEAYLDATGFHPLPTEGLLSDQTPQPLEPGALAAKLAARKPVDIAALPAALWEPLTIEDVSRLYPAMAEWMLPSQDVVIRVQPGSPPAAWLAQPACLVVRVRGQRATVIGGSLLAALRPPL